MCVFKPQKDFIFIYWIDILFEKPLNFYLVQKEFFQNIYAVKEDKILLKLKHTLASESSIWLLMPQPPPLHSNLYLHFVILWSYIGYRIIDLAF